MNNKNNIIWSPKIFQDPISNLYMTYKEKVLTFDELWETDHDPLMIYLQFFSWN